VISRVAAYLQGEANAAIRYERPALAPVERVTESALLCYSRRISAWSVQERNGQECDGTMVWCKEDPQVRRSSIKCECE
jgi:hypothetical protein